MSQPADIKDTRARSRGRLIKPGSKAEVRWDTLEKEEVLTGQHNPDDIWAAASLARIAPELEELERLGKDSKVRQLKRVKGLYEDARFAVRSSWCPTCINVFHNCICPLPPMPDKVSMEFMDDFNARRLQQVEEARKTKKRAARMARKEEMRKGRTTTHGQV